MRSTHDDSTREPSRGRLRALLAGGLVLGVGAVSSLAVFTDPVFIVGAFDVDVKWAVEGSTVRTTPTTDAGWGWKGAPSDPGDTMDFELIDSTNGVRTAYEYQPGRVMYAPYTLRMDPQSPDGGDITLEGARNLAPDPNGSDILFGRMWYAVKIAPNPESCNPTWWGTEPTVTPSPADPNYVVQPVSPLSTGNSTARRLVQGQKTTYCFRMTAHPQEIEVNPIDLPKYDKHMAIAWVFRAVRVAATA